MGNTELFRPGYLSHNFLSNEQKVYNFKDNISKLICQDTIRPFCLKLEL